MYLPKFQEPLASQQAWTKHTTRPVDFCDPKGEWRMLPREDASAGGCQPHLVKKVVACFVRLGSRTEHYEGYCISSRSESCYVPIILWCVLLVLQLWNCCRCSKEYDLLFGPDLWFLSIPAIHKGCVWARSALGERWESKTCGAEAKRHHEDPSFDSRNF